MGFIKKIDQDIGENMNGLRKELSFNYFSRKNGNHYDEELKFSEN